jgi:hypothetical protein
MRLKKEGSLVLVIGLFKMRDSVTGWIHPRPVPCGFKDLVSLLNPRNQLFL